MASRHHHNHSHNFNFEATFQHPLARRGLVEFVPTWWVHDLANPQAGHIADTSPGSTEMLTLEQLWQHMKANGMRDPFILAAGRYTRECRLEAGNHRIKTFVAHGIDYVPACVIVNDDAKVSDNNGDHKYQRDLLLMPQTYDLRSYDERIYMKPGDVFRQIREMRDKGFLPAPPRLV